MYKLNIIETIKRTNALTLNRLLAEKLKTIINLEEFQSLKLSSGNKRLPDSELAVYTRAASVLIKLVHRPTSIQKLATAYNRKSNRGVKPSKVRGAARAILRKICNKLESQNLLAKCTKGRYSSKEGRNLILETIDEIK